MKKELLQAGKIVNTHALRGDLRIYPYCDGPEFLCEVKKLYIDDTPYTVTSAKVHKGQALIHLKGIDHINQAEPLIGKLVYLKKDEVPLDEGQYFIDDIIGLSVKDVDTGEIYGKVTFLDMPLIYYRVHGGNVTGGETTFNQKMKWRRYLIEKLIKRVVFKK
jgi:16S rRNA processing protein RimM